MLKMIRAWQSLIAFTLSSFAMSTPAQSQPLSANEEAYCQINFTMYGKKDVDQGASRLLDQFCENWELPQNLLTQYLVVSRGWDCVIIHQNWAEEYGIQWPQDSDFVHSIGGNFCLYQRQLEAEAKGENFESENTASPDDFFKDVLDIYREADEQRIPYSPANQ